MKYGPWITVMTCAHCEEPIDLSHFVSNKCCPKCGVIGYKGLAPDVKDVVCRLTWEEDTNIPWWNFWAKPKKINIGIELKEEFDEKNKTLAEN